MTTKFARKATFFCLSLGLAFLQLSSESQARITDFNEPHQGILSGAGTYFFPLVNDNVFDPVPLLAPTGTTVSNSEKTYLLPIRIGYFMQTASFDIEAYGLYMSNLRSSWTSSGDLKGSGKSLFASYGLGANLGINLWQQSHLRLNFVFNAEYVLQRLSLDWSPSSGAAGQSLKLKTQSLLTGIGLQPEIWLGDMYVLSLLAGYQYGFLRNWEATAVGRLFDQDYTAGALSSPRTGGAIPAQFGGLLLAATLKLNF